MIVNIQNLLTQLFRNTNIPNSSSSSEALSMQLLAGREFLRLHSSNEADKQAKMIRLFFGGTILALLQDELKYGYDTGALAIARKTWEQVEPTEGFNEAASLANIYHIGNYVVANLPNSIPDDLYTRGRVSKVNEGFIRFFPVDPLGPMFPRLSDNIGQVNQLLQFCAQYKDHLETETFDDGVEVLNDREVQPDVRGEQPIPRDENSSEEDSTTEEQASFCTPRATNISMQVLGGFIAVLGVAAVAAGLVLLSAASMGVVVGLGVAVGLAGLGLFAAGRYKNYKLEQELNNSTPLEENSEEISDCFAFS